MTLTPTLRSTLITFASFIFVITAVNAWTGPSVSAPNGNVSAPLTVSATSQSKTGGLDVGWLSAVGAVKVGYTATACSAELAGSLRWNTGVMEYCNGTVWGPFGGSSTGGGGGDSPYCAFTGKFSSVSVAAGLSTGSCSINVDQSGWQTISVSAVGGNTVIGGTSCSNQATNSDIVSCSFLSAGMVDISYVTYPSSISASFNRTTGVLSCSQSDGAAGGSSSNSSTITPDSSLCSSIGGAETDPTVPAYIKDGTDWSEVTNKPTSFPGAFSHIIYSANGNNCTLECGGSTRYRGVSVNAGYPNEVNTGTACLCFWN